jgi:hypothetical protein
MSPPLRPFHAADLAHDAPVAINGPVLAAAVAAGNGVTDSFPELFF